MEPDWIYGSVIFFIALFLFLHLIEFISKAYKIKKEVLHDV